MDSKLIKSIQNIKCIVHETKLGAVLMEDGTIFVLPCDECLNKAFQEGINGDVDES